MTVYGEIITGTHVREAVESTIKMWFPSYIAEVARQRGWTGPPLPDFCSYTGSVDLDRLVEMQVPSCVIVAPGLVDPPTKEGTGTVRARWGVSIAATVSGQNVENTMNLAEMYAAAIRTLILQQKSLGGFAEGTDWRNEAYDEVTADDSRTMCIGIVEMTIEVRGVADTTQGPLVPPVDPTADPGEWTTVETVSVTINERTD